MKRAMNSWILGLALTGSAGMCAVVPLLYGQTKPKVFIPADTGSYREVVRQVLPAVVSIESTPKAVAVRGEMPRHGNPFGGFPGLPDDLRKRFEEFGQTPQMPEEMPHKAFGSGVIVDAKGIILTNDHVVRGADKVEIQLQDGRKFTSKDIKKDPKTDLAIVRIDSKEPLPFLEMGDSSQMEIGDRVLAIGAPLGLKGTVTTGIISAKGRDIHMNMYEDFLQTDAAINPGNSGGPLVNLAGQVIGINSAIKSSTGGFQGIGLAISSNMVKDIMAQLLKDGTVHRGYLGVNIQPLDPEVAKHLGLTDKGGVVIAKVTKGSPAAKAGMMDGDVLTSVDGKPVKDARDLQHLVASMQRGKPAEITIFRDGASKTLKVTIEEQPKNLASANTGTQEPSDQEPTQLDKLGLKVTDLTPETAKQLGFGDKTEGVLISGVDHNSPAEEAGLHSGTVILKMDQHPVRNVEDAQKVLAKASLEKGVLLQIESAKGGTSYVLLHS